MARSILCVACICLASIVNAQSLTPPVGSPYISVFAKVAVADAPWLETDFMTNVAQWLSFRYTALRGITPSRVGIFDQVYNATGDGYNQFSIALDNVQYDNGFSYTYLNLMVPSLVANGVLGVNISVANATLVENPSPSVQITFDSFPTQYNGSWTGPIKMNLDFSPKVGTNMSIGINSTNVEVDPWPLVVTFPAVSATFRLRSFIPATYRFTRTILGGTDETNRYDFNVFQPTWTNSILADIVITPPAASVLNYDGQMTDSYTIMIPSSYLYPNPRVVVGIRATPAGMTISSTSIAITARGTPYTFFCIGPVGTFTLSYTIGPPTNIQNQNNNFFNSPTVTHTVTFLPKLNVSSSSIPDAFMAAPPASSIYGGAFSVPVPFHIQRSPRRGLTVSIDVENGEASPAVLTFAPAGTKVLYYRARSLSTGIKTVSFTLGGLSVGDYDPPAVRLWRVFGPNPACIGRHDATTCFDTNGCSWNQMKAVCTNRTLPILLSLVPQLFDGERSKNITLTLPTPVRSQLRITFVASGRATFSPASITLNAGQFTANYTILPALNPREDLVQQDYYMQLNGADANTYTQQTASIQIRSKIVCTTDYPWSFYVGTTSKLYTLTCDTPPEVDVTFTPLAVGQVGLAFVLVPPLTTNNRSLFMNPGVNSVSFYAVSSATRRTGNFTITYTIGGTNAARYAVVPPVPVRILPLGQLNNPPYFRITEKLLSPWYNVDISITPEEVVYVSILVYNASSNQTVPPEIVIVNPTNLTYNDTLRNQIQLSGTVPGRYYLTFNISGLISNYFLPTTRSYFEIMPRLGGSAFTPRLKLGFMPQTRCRVNVGRNSEFFKGQNAVDDLPEFCVKYKPVLANSTYDCESIPTEMECRDAIRDTGNLCIWNMTRCVLLRELQGNVTDVAYGSNFTVLLTRNMTVFTIGSTRYGQLGHSNFTLAQVMIPDNITAIVSGTAHTLALSQQGYIWAWGNNNQGQLGIGSISQEIIKPTRLTFPKGENITCISAGTLHSAAVSLSGIAYVWGSNLFGQLGNLGTFQTIARTPVAIGRDKFDGDSAVAIQCGEYHTMVATELAAYTFGLNSQGQLGRPGFDEWKPAKPILWTPSRFVAHPNYPSYVTGSNRCPP